MNKINSLKAKRINFLLVVKTNSAEERKKISNLRNPAKNSSDPSHEERAKGRRSGEADSTRRLRQQSRQENRTK